MNNAVGVTPLLNLLEKGVLVGLGTDGMGSDMLAKCVAPICSTAWQTTTHAWHSWKHPSSCFRTIRRIAERQFGLRLGEIAEGRPADLAILDYQPPTPLDETNFLGHLIFGLVDATVDTTVCKGKILMKGKKILSMDEERITPARANLRQRCGSDCKNFNQSDMSSAQ